MRFNLRVGPELYLRCQLKLGDGSSRGAGWFADAEMEELMSMLHLELPRRVPLLSGSMAPEIVRGDSLQVCLTFVPNITNCWLLSGGQEESAEAAPGAGVTGDRASYAATYAPLSHTLLLHVEPFDVDSSEAQPMHSAPSNATIAQKPIEGYFAKAGGASAQGTR